MALGATGVLMNVDVVLLNAGMPVLLGESAKTGSFAAAAEFAHGTGSFYRVAQQADALKWLGDAMPITMGRSLVWSALATSCSWSRLRWSSCMGCLLTLQAHPHPLGSRDRG